MFSGFVHVEKCISTCLPLLGWTTFRLLCSVDIWMVSSFLVLWIVHECLLHICFSPFEYTPRSRTAGSCGISVFAELFLLLRNCQTVGHPHFIFPSAVCEGSIFSTSPPAKQNIHCFLSVLKKLVSVVGVKSHYFDLHFPHD